MENLNKSHSINSDELRELENSNFEMDIKKDDLVSNKKSEKNLNEKIKTQNSIKSMNDIQNKNSIFKIINFFYKQIKKEHQ